MALSLKKTTRTEAGAEFSGNEVGRQERGVAVDAISEEPGSDCLAVEDGVDITPRPSRMLYNEGVRYQANTVVRSLG